MMSSHAVIARAKENETGSANPDPTMAHPPGSPKGENMPPRGGEDIAPADATRSPKATQKQIERDDERPRD